MTVLTKIATIRFGCLIDNDSDGFDEDEDCDDSDASIYPGAPEVENDGIDQDCDGSDLIIPLDLDGDGFDETGGL